MYSTITTKALLLYREILARALFQHADRRTRHNRHAYAAVMYELVRRHVL